MLKRLILPGLIVLFSLAFVLLTAATNVSREDLATFTTEAIAPSIRIGDVGGRSFCSGTMVASDRDEESGDVTTFILTASHCTERTGQRLEVIVPRFEANAVVGEDHLMADVTNRYVKADLALLTLVDKDTLYTTLANVAPEGTELLEGEDTFTVGFAGAMSRTVTEGTFGYRERAQIGSYPEREFYRATPALVPGNSGGALFHKTEDGTFELIGVSDAVFTGMWHMGYYVPVEDVRAFLEPAFRLAKVDIPWASQEEAEDQASSVPAASGVTSGE